MIDFAAIGQRLMAYAETPSDVDAAKAAARDASVLYAEVLDLQAVIRRLTEVIAQGETLIEERDARIGDLAAALLEAERRASIAERKADGLQVALAEVARAREEAGRG